MTAPTQVIEPGDALFHEGEPAISAFFIVSGRVVLKKDSPEGLVDIDFLGPGDLAGEAGLLRNGVYSVTAIAETRVEFDELDRAALMDRVRREPDITLRLAGHFARRIAVLTERLVRPAPEPHTRATGVSATRRMASWFRNLFRRRRTDSGALAEIPRSLKVAIAIFLNDDEDSQRILVEGAFLTLPGVEVVLLNDAVEVSSEGNLLTVLTQAGRVAHRMLERENADVVIWGLVDTDADLLELHFATFSERDEERPGAPSLLSWLGLPTGFEADWEPLLCATTLAAIEPRSELQSQTLDAILPPLVADAQSLGLSPPDFFSGAEKAAILESFGNAAATAGHMTDGAEWFDQALEAYRTALETLPRDADLEWALLNRSIGVVLQSVGERTGDPAPLTEAAEAYRTALEGIIRRDTPRDWAKLHYRLGEVLYRRALLDGSDLFKECVDSLQNALQVYSRKEFPAKWAEIVNLLSQVLQVYGDEVKAISLLKRAVDLSQQVLEVRTLDTVPLAWAAAQNTLGSSLFLLGRNTGERATLEDAREAFQASLGVYRMMNAEKGASVAENNLRRVEEFLEKSTPVHRRLEPEWASGDRKALAPETEKEKETPGSSSGSTQS
ncbi:cyclic nucleotide-binding domain-containing protein [Phaeovibrio sulfidiphilus]|uniref:Cyclic nucleotide-binding domain-containing protein n=1 Tax=Phaeovibrio sulfidiphilus TaxID=1220600 RepID=A0A8J7CVK7_9PROT|nr:cyclic nucleotide-binding domain-containing protein [Phaeovibrio sulfidiphilus]